MKTLYVILAVLAIIIIGFFLFRAFPSGKSAFISLFPASTLTDKGNATATIQGKSIQLLIAKTPQEQHTGLSDRNSLAQDTGMVFVFNHPDYYLFWMRHMKFPLDIIYLHGNKIVTLLQNVKNPAYSVVNPPILRPQAPADKVIEVNAGFAQKYNLKTGDTVALSL